jgi:cytochrome c553
MKKLILFISLAVIAGLLVVFGPGLLGLYRLQNYIAATDEAYKADGSPWPHLTDVCMGCHGAKGTSLDQGYPSLAGQPVSYVATQLLNFASGPRANPTMGPLAMTLSDTEIKSLSDYYSKQVAVKNQFFTPDPSLRSKGEQLVMAGRCAACHGAKLMGHDQFPRLAGQGYDYILKQIDAFADDSRVEATGAMKSISVAMSPEDRKAVASYLASMDLDK